MASDGLSGGGFACEDRQEEILNYTTTEFGTLLMGTLNSNGCVCCGRGCNSKMAVCPHVETMEEGGGASTYLDSLHRRLHCCRWPWLCSCRE